MRIVLKTRHLPSPTCFAPCSRSGVALIITVIMLSVITFLAVAFLALSGREKGAVKTSTDQTTARLAADTAMARAQAEMLAGILATTNFANFDLLVSTNYFNGNGFDTASIPDPDRLTNVNYFLPNGNPVTGNDALQNLANLFYNPSPPVFITNRLAANSMEFRSYLDLNRNGRLDRTGFWGVTNNLNNPIVISNRFASNYVTGDPQWIGGLERIELPHSGSNKFLYRFAYLTVPEGQTLDVNYNHNNAKNPAQMNYFLRNQGVGAWEINLAAFLADLNTNYWNTQFAPYDYRTNGGLASTGIAFDDAYALWNWRRGGVAQRSVFDLYGNAGVTAFLNDWADGYSQGLVQDSLQGYTTDPDIGRTSNPWSGADMPNHFFTTQDLFDPNKTQMPFHDRLSQASTNNSTYDQYTYYRLLSQLGTASAPADADKLNLNHKNVGGVSATDFVEWTPEDFFTNAADRLLTRYSQEWLDTEFNNYTNLFGTNQAFGVSAIPVMVGNRFIYTPSVHRLLQVAANIADTKTDTLWPTVYRPIFTKDNQRLYITGYEAVLTNGVSAYLAPPIEASAVPVGAGQRTNVYGVPWVVGAKKGLPNFNEFSMHSLFEITRKLQITRPSVGAPKSDWETNIMYTVGVSNAIGIEAWNSYRNDFTNPVVIRVAGDVTMVLTNEYGIPAANGRSLSNSIPILAITNLTTLNPWRGYGTRAEPQSSSFQVPLRTNIAFLPESVYNIQSRTFNTNLDVAFETGLPQQKFVPLQWGLFCSVRLRFVMQLGDINGPIIDYVQLDDLNSYRNLSEEIRDPDLATGFAGLWSTNAIGSSSTLPQGIMNQMNISLGLYELGSDWKPYDRTGRTGSQIQNEIDYFKGFLGMRGYPTSTSLVQQVPFTPTRRVLQEFSWQANDPLVHYLAGDLLDITRTNNVEKPTLAAPLQLLENIGRINKRYSPWGGNPVNASPSPNNFSAAVKDPAVGSSDAWQFPTNAFPSLGWLGRVHRGTPWQTIYLKASDLNMAPVAGALHPNSWTAAQQASATRWIEWTANTIQWSTNGGDYSDAFFSRPATDRLLFDVFTTAVNENASRGLLSVNQTNLAAWSAVFSGVVALTNSTSTNRLQNGYPPTFSPLIIQPAGYYDAFDTNTWSPLVRVVAGINAERQRTNTAGGYIHPGGWFHSAGDLLSVPELTDASPFLSLSTNSLSFSRGVNDAAYEWLPQQVMSLVRLDEPRFVIYAYGQALRPAENSIVTATGPFFNLCTNYQITAEVAARAVVRVEGSANPNDRDNPNPKRKYPPRLIVESYNYLPPE